MTEQEWLISEHPWSMLECLRGRASERKCCLLSVACWHRLWDRMDKASRAATDAAERSAEALKGITARGLRSARREAELAVAFAAGRSLNMRKAERAAQARLLRDLFGNPFQPARLARAWRTPTVVALAQAMYEDRRFDDMPLLADALEESGCTEEAILKHCREPGEHVRGCWVVDLVLGKE